MLTLHSNPVQVLMFLIWSSSLLYFFQAALYVQQDQPPCPPPPPAPQTDLIPEPTGPIVPSDPSSVPTHLFPPKIWLTGRTLDPATQSSLATWLALNPSHRFEFLSDAAAETYVRTHFADRPAMLAPFLRLTSPILRADLLRLMILYASGGTYIDSDVVCNAPIDDWVPAEYRDTAAVVVGLEVDRPTRILSSGLPFVGLATWTIQARARSRTMETVLTHVLSRLAALAAGRTPDGDYALLGTPAAPLHEEDVLCSTGPTTFTDGVLLALSAQLGEEVDWRNITDLKEPRLIGDVLFLPINAFGSGQVHSHSGDDDRGPMLVYHLFRGSWKNRIGNE